MVWSNRRIIHSTTPEREYAGGGPLPVSWTPLPVLHMA